MSQIKDLLKDVLTKSEYDIWIEPIVEHTAEETGKAILIVPNIYFKNRISEILKVQNLSAEIIIHEQQHPSEIRQPLSTKTLQMEKPYSKEKVATSDIINSKFFKYPNDSRKYSATEIVFNGEEYIVHRGKSTPDPDEEPIEQLDTNHLRILLAIIHTWQEQNCRFLARHQALVDLSVTLREIAKKIGYNLGGKNIQWLQQKVEELTKYPITLERKTDGKASSFTFINKLTTQTEQKKYMKKVLKITLNPILSQQLYERKAILRNKECYKIKNPTSLKFLLTYDKRIYAAQEPFTLSIEGIAKELEIRGSKRDKTKAIERVIKNLNGYKLGDNSEISLELVKEGRERFLMVGKRESTPNLPSWTINAEGTIIEVRE
jgi:hypothetical protein